MSSTDFKWAIRGNDFGVWECSVITGENKTKKAVGGYIDSQSRGGMTDVYLPWVEMDTALLDAPTKESARASVEDLAARLLAVVVEWEAEQKAKANG
jgi:hypothetical protein